MFSGMGNMRLGFEQAGWECVYSIEFDKHKREIYKAIYGKEPEGNDITDIRGTDLPSAELWAFGAPCQDFSIAGLRAGLDGTRSGLVREVFRLVREKEPADRPEWLLYENVKGMLSSNGGWDFAAIQAEMGQCGYDVQWQLLNSKDFGVPQNRERVFTIGHLRRCGTRQIFPIGRNNSKVIKEELKINPSRHSSLMNSVLNIDGISPTLDCMQGGNRQPEVIVRPDGRRFKEPDDPMSALTKQDIHGVSIIEDFYRGRKPREYTDNAPTLRKGRQGLKVRVFDTISRCIKSGNHDAGVIIKEATQKGYAEAHEGNSINLSLPNSKTRRGRVGKGIAHTLDTQCNQATLQNTRIRRLTPRECMRLQGVPDSITDKIIRAGISDTQMYRAAGDAVTVNVIKAIAERMKKNEIQKKTSSNRSVSI